MSKPAPPPPPPPHPFSAIAVIVSLISILTSIVRIPARIVQAIPAPITRALLLLLIPVATVLALVVLFLFSFPLTFLNRWWYGGYKNRMVGGGGWLQRVCGYLGIDWSRRPRSSSASASASTSDSGSDGGDGEEERTSTLLIWIALEAIKGVVDSYGRRAAERERLRRRSSTDSSRAPPKHPSAASSRDEQMRQKWEESAREHAHRRFSTGGPGMFASAPAPSMAPRAAASKPASQPMDARRRTYTTHAAGATHTKTAAASNRTLPRTSPAPMMPSSRHSHQPSYGLSGLGIAGSAVPGFMFASASPPASPVTSARSGKPPQPRSYTPVGGDANRARASTWAGDGKSTARFEGSSATYERERMFVQTALLNQRLRQLTPPQGQ